MSKLYFYYSAMNAGKTTTLLQSSYNYRERGMDTILFTPDIISKDKIFSRIGLKSTAVSFDEKFDFFEYVQKKISKPDNKVKCILVDESHFLTKNHVVQLVKVVDDLGLPVLTYGLRSDFLGIPFESSKYLLAWADKLIEIKTICFCGRKATMNLRINPDGKAIKEGPQFEVGGNERYIAMCRKHFYESLEKGISVNNNV